MIVDIILMFLGAMEVFPDLIVETISSGKELKDFKDKLIQAQSQTPKEEGKKQADKSDGVLVLVKFSFGSLKKL